ncbi:MAG: DUF2508 family protein [Halanaerobiales bacterium]
MVLTDIKNQFHGFLERFRTTWQPILEDSGLIPQHEPDLKEKLSKAKREWREAQSYFNNVTEPELIDHAAFLIGAAERKYMYLLRKYKERIK